MPSIITGQIGEADLHSVMTFKRDVGLGIALLDPKSAPLVLLSQTGMDPRNIADASKASLAKLASVDPKIEWIEDQLVPTDDAINNEAGYLSTDTLLVVDNGPYFYANCYGYVKRTGEIFSVTSVSTNTLTVSRGALSTTAAALLDNDEIVILDLANEEGAAVPTARSTLKDLAYNYCEIVRTPVSMTETTKNTAMLGEERDWEFQKRKAGIAHAEKIEKKFLYGARSISRTGTETKRTMGGLTSFITTNVYNAGGSLTEDNFNLYVCEPVFKRGRGSSYRVLLASQRLNSVICGWGNNKVRTNVGASKLGFVVNEYVSPHGLIYVIPHHLISGTQGLSGIMIDPEKLRYRYLQNRDTQWKDDVVKTGVDGTTSEYLSEVSLEIRNESCHGLINDVQK
jgi:hypothetical protein